MLTQNDLICSFDINKTGIALPVESNEISKAIPKTKFRWIHFDRTGSYVEKWLKEDAAIPETALQPLLAEETRPRVQSIENGFLINLRGVNLNPNASPEDMVAVRLWVDENRIISLRKYKLLAVQDIRDNYEQGKGPATIGAFLSKLVFGLVDRMSSVILDLDDTLDELESKVLEIPDKQDRDKLGIIRRQSISLKRFLSPQREALSKLASLDIKWMTDEHKLQLREGYDQTSRMIEALDAIRERAGLLHEEFASQLAEKNNRNSYVLTVIAAIFLPLGFLTGLLGINVGGIPGVENPNAFLWVTIAIFIIGVLEYMLFKLLRWL